MIETTTDQYLQLNINAMERVMSTSTIILCILAAFAITGCSLEAWEQIALHFGF